MSVVPQDLPPDEAFPQPRGRLGSPSERAWEPEVIRGTDPEDWAEPWEQEPLEPLVRPAWWRWVAIAVVVAMVDATPLADAMSVLLR